MVKTKIIQWKCPHCSKVLESMYPKQLEQHKQGHLFSHRKDGDKQ